MSQKAFVICCNDSVEAVCLGTDKEAESKMETLKSEYYARCGIAAKDLEAFSARLRWHIRETPVV